MRGSLVSVLNHSLISRFFRSLVIIGLAAAATFTAALPLMAAEESITQAADGCIFATWDEDGTLMYYDEGDYFDPDMLGEYIAFGPCVYTNLAKGCTYTITFRLYYDWHLLQPYDECELGSVSIHDSLPEYFDELVPLMNSAGVLNSNFVSTDIGISSANPYLRFTIAFSTADGYIDNFTPGEQYIIFNYSAKAGTSKNNYVEDITVKCVFDPSAEYYQWLCLEKLEQKGNELEAVGGEASKHENWALDKAAELHSQASEQMSLNLDIAKSFLQTSTFADGGNSIAATAATFGTIYNQFTSALPPQLQALIIIIPTLAFIGWVVGRVQ